MEDIDLTTILLVVIPVLLLAAGGGFVYWWRMRGERQEEVYHFRCPACKRKLRYVARQVGHRGMCGNCKQPLTFPPVHAAER
jgi:hypothetical protein